MPQKWNVAIISFVVVLVYSMELSLKCTPSSLANPLVLVDFSPTRNKLKWVVCYAFTNIVTLSSMETCTNFQGFIWAHPKQLVSTKKTSH